MQNIKFVPGTIVETEIATQHAFNAISEAIYLACKYMIEVNLNINQCMLHIDCNSNPFQKEIEYKKWHASKNNNTEITLVTK